MKHRPLYRDLPFFYNREPKKYSQNERMLKERHTSTIFDAMMVDNSSYYTRELLLRRYTSSFKQSTAVLCVYFIYRMALFEWSLYHKLGLSHKSSTIYYVHSTGVIAPFLVPFPSKIPYSKQTYKQEVVRLSGHKPLRIPYPISKQDFLNQSLGVIEHKDYKIKGVKNIYKAHTFDKNTGTHINRPDSPPITIHLFIELTGELTETTLYFDFITAVIKAVNTWFITHPNSFYEKYHFVVDIRMIYNYNKNSRSKMKSFIRENNPFYYQNKVNNRLIISSQLFELKFKTFYENWQFKEGRIIEDEILQQYSKDLRALKIQYDTMIHPYLRDQPNVISLLPFPRQKNLSFYHSLFSQGLKCVHERVRKHSVISLSSPIELIHVRKKNPPNPLLLPTDFIRGSHRGQYNINAFLYTTPENLRLYYYAQP